MYAKKKIEISQEAFLGEVERYSNSIFRYETDSDRICKTHYLQARAYDLCDEKDKGANRCKS